MKEGSVNDEIELDIGAGQYIYATVTRERRDFLGLHPGMEVWALVKASSVTLCNEENDFKFSTRNILTGNVTRVEGRAVNSEVIIGLAGGNALMALVTNPSAKILGLAAGKPLTPCSRCPT